MIYSGLASITFRGLKPKEIITLAVKAGLNGIEWGSDFHVPVNNLNAADEIKNMTLDAGLNIIAYGSYYRLGEKHLNIFEFQKILETAVALNAPVIRVWAGNMSSNKADDEYQNKIIIETKIIATLAAEANIEVAFESHQNTLTDTGISSVNLLKKINCKNVKTYWQPISSISKEKNLEKLELVLSWIKNIHVFYWHHDITNRLRLKDGEKEWQDFFNKISTVKKDIYAILEFVKNDSQKQSLADAKILKKLINKITK